MRCGAKDLTRLEFSFKIPLFLWQTVEVRLGVLHLLGREPKGHGYGVRSGSPGNAYLTGATASREFPGLGLLETYGLSILGSVTI